MRRRPTITREALEQLIVDGEIDTVVVAFPDLQGRMVGKRTTGRFFLDQVADGGTENCDYLIACDLDNEPVPGYRFTSYDQGYGDMLARPDWSTVRVTPWVERTALVLCDLHEVDSGEPIEVAPRTVLRRQVEAAASLGYLPMVASEIEFYLFHDTYDEAHAKGYRDLRPHSPWLEDYHVLQTTKDEYVIGAIRRGLEAAGVPVEFSKGEAGRGQHEINLDYAEAVEMADRNLVYKTAAKEIAHQHGRSVSFMAKYAFDDTGSSCHIHSSLWSPDGQPGVVRRGRAAAHERGVPPVPRRADRHGSRVQPAVGADGQQLQAVPARFVGADGCRLGRRQPHARLPQGRPRCRHARRVSHPGRGRQHLLRIRRHDRRRSVRDPPRAASSARRSSATATRPTTIERIPWNLPDAIALWEASDAARECFGDDVHHHILTMAKAEWQAFNRTVTDWELRRYWERI